MASTDPLDLADELLEVSGALVRAARRSVGDGLRVELSVAQMELLRLVRQCPNLAVADAAAELHLARNTVSTLVGQLTSLGLLERAPDEHDGRVGRLRLAPPAEQRMSAWRARRLAATAAAVAELSPDEAAAVAKALPSLRQLGARLAPAPGSAA